MNVLGGQWEGYRGGSGRILGGGLQGEVMEGSGKVLGRVQHATDSFVGVAWGYAPARLRTIGIVEMFAIVKHREVC